MQACHPVSFGVQVAVVKVALQHAMEGKAPRYIQWSEVLCEGLELSARYQPARYDHFWINMLCLTSLCSVVCSRFQ